VSEASAFCATCGAIPVDGRIQHAWVEGMCILPHRSHSRATIGHVCDWCVDRHRKTLDEITTLYATLHEVIPLGAVPDDTATEKRHLKRPASPAQMNLDAWAMLHDRDRLFRTGEFSDLPDVPAVLSEKAQELYDALGWLATAPTTVSGACAALRAHADAVAVQPWIDEYDADLRWLLAKLRLAHRLDPPRPLARCMSIGCGGRVWRDKDGKEPACDRCRRRYGQRDQAKLRVQEEIEARDKTPPPPSGSSTGPEPTNAA
jgi:hypothetical protein